MSGPAATTGNLSFFVSPPEGVRAYEHLNEDPITGERRKNWERESIDVEIENIRGKEVQYTLDKAAFQLGKRPATHKAFIDDLEIEKEYYPESIQLLKDVTGASRVLIFDHTIRRRRPNEFDSDEKKRQPVSQAHVDQTTKAAIARVHRHLPAEDAPALLQRRFQVINLWRPISHTAYDWPLSLCDYRSVDPSKDVFPVTLIHPDREGETMGIKYNPNQKWKYYYGVTPEEYILIKCFDSVQDGSVAVFTPHSGFADPATPEGSPLRESIELRALVFYD